MVYASPLDLDLEKEIVLEVQDVDAPEYLMVLRGDTQDAE